MELKAKVEGQMAEILTPEALAFVEKLCREFEPTRAQWLAERRDPKPDERGRPLYITDEEDLANAYLAALAAVQVGHGRFDAVFIAGDEREDEHNLAKARRLLGWEPRAQRLLTDG